MIDIGRLCVKIAGRDAGRACVIVEKIDNNFVMIDGNTRRRKCNIKHLQALPTILKIKEKASHDEVIKALANAGIKVIESKKKAKEPKKETKPLLKRKSKKTDKAKK